MSTTQISLLQYKSEWNNKISKIYHSLAIQENIE